MGTINHTQLDWIHVSDCCKPMKGATVVAFTPVWGARRFRVVGEDLLHTLSEATHWAYLTGPMGDESN